MTLPVVIPTRTVGCPPTCALIIEGFEVTEVVMQDDYHYGRLIAAQWLARTGFVVVEDDVVPWPGAIQAMLDCPQEWCGYQSPRLWVGTTARGGFTHGLGCTKFSPEIVARFTPEWDQKRWDEVDGAVFGMLDGLSCHIHEPPVAHIKPSVLLVRKRGDIPWGN